MAADAIEPLPAFAFKILRGRHALIPAMARRAADAIVNSSIIMQICLKKSKTAVNDLAVAAITACCWRGVYH